MNNKEKEQNTQDIQDGSCPLCMGTNKPHYPIIVGFMGTNGAGKSTLARELKEVLNGSYYSHSGIFAVRRSFSTPLKLCLANILDVDPSAVTGEQYRVYREEPNKACEKIFGFNGETIRKALILFGNAQRNYFSDDFWVRVMDNWLEPRVHNFECLIIDDVRTEAEYQWIRKHPRGIVFQIGTTEQMRKARKRNTLIPQLINEPDKYRMCLSINIARIQDWLEQAYQIENT